MSGSGEWEWGGYSRVENVERVENEEPRRICRGSCLAQFLVGCQSVGQEHDAGGRRGSGGERSDNG